MQSYEVKLRPAIAAMLARLARVCSDPPEKIIASIITDVLVDDALAHEVGGDQEIDEILAYALVERRRDRGQLN